MSCTTGLYVDITAGTRPGRGWHRSGVESANCVFSVARSSIDGLASPPEAGCDPQCLVEDRLHAASCEPRLAADVRFAGRARDDPVRPRDDVVAAERVHDWY